MKSKKDQGNAHFKKQHFTQAIECYKQYVSIQNDDNCKAYSNMALSYFKLKQYENCIQACERAVELQPQFEKPFYRMYQAYKQLNDLYGMVISASRFCRLSKEEKDVKAVEKEVAKVKEELRFRYMVRGQQQQKDKKINLTNVDNDNIIIASILALSNHPTKRQSQSITINKQPQMCKQSKWQRIAQLAKHNKRQGLNSAIRFINQLASQQQKERYRRLYSRLRQLPLHGQESSQAINHNVDDDNNNNNEGRQQNKQSSSQQQQLRIQQLQKYAEQQRKKKQKETEHKRQQQQKQQNHQKQQKQQQKPQTHEDQQQQQFPQQQQKQQQKQLQQSQQKQPTSITDSNNQQQQHPQQQQSQPLITQQQSNLLFTQHISNLITKSQDPFTAFYQSLSNVLKSSQLNKLQKQTILSQCPSKVKKFNMLMKSYSGKQKLQLQQLFISNHLHHIWSQKFVNLNTGNANINGNSKK